MEGSSSISIPPLYSYVLCQPPPRNGGKVRATGRERGETEFERERGGDDTASDIDRKVTARAKENTFCAANAIPPPHTHIGTRRHFFLQGINCDGISDGFQNASILACRDHGIWPQTQIQLLRLWSTHARTRGEREREDRDTHTTHTCTDAAGKFDTQTRSAYHHMQFFGSVIRACLWAESPATSPEKNSPEKEAHMENPRDTLAEAEKVVKRKMLP